MPWEVDEERVRSLLESQPNEPWARAWTTGMAARAGVGMGERAEGLLHSADYNDWSPRFRHVETVRQRVHAMAHLSMAADALGAGETDRFGIAWDRFESVEVPADDLEHPEIALVATLLDAKMPAEGVRVQLTWRGHAAAALAWALGGFDDLEEAARQEDTLSDIIIGVQLSAPRPLEEVLAALQKTSSELAELERHTARHSVLIERKKALRWLTEPWWPEIALVPWRGSDALAPRTPEGFDREALVVENQIRGEGPHDDTLQLPADVLEMGLSLLLQGSYLADATRQSRMVVGPMAKLAEQTGITPKTAELERLVTWAKDGTGKEPTEKELTALVWLSACADALFWAVGTLDELPEGDPDEEVYTALIPLIRAGGIPKLVNDAGLRPRAEIEAELSRWQAIVAASEPATLEESFGIQRTRGLRWILEPNWEDPTVTPWDGSDIVKPFVPASLGPSNPSTLRVAAVAVMVVVAVGAAAAWSLGLF